jgi:ribosomal protein S27AE
MNSINFYEILEISPHATSDEIRNAYKKLSKSVHPDRGGSAALFRLVNEAYQVLSDPIKRREHDQEISSSKGSREEQINQEPIFVKFEDLYRQWKENRSKIECPAEESIEAGGIRRLVRSSSLLLYPYSNDPKNAFFRKPEKSIDFAICGRCGQSSFPLWMVQTRPLQFQTETQNKGFIIGHGEKFKLCGKCGETPATLYIVQQEVETFIKEPISIEVGDLLMFRAKFLSSRLIAFGPVIEGSAYSDNAIRTLKVKDEFSGDLLSPKSWTEIVGVWKSNTLEQNRSSSTRNWG